MKGRKIQFFDIAAMALCLLFIVAGILVCLNRYWQYEVFYDSYGLYDTAIWSVAHFHAPIIDHFIVGGKWIFADHFSPSVFLLSPLYWLTNRSEMLLVAQAILVGLSGWIIYQIGIVVTKNKFFSFSILTSYLLFAGLQNAVIADFHELTISTFFLSLCLWAIVKQKKVLYLVSLIILLGFKESLGLLGVGLSVIAFFINRDWMKLALFSGLVSVVWTSVTIKLVIPFFSGGSYIYVPDYSNSPLDFFSVFFGNAEKRKTLFFSFLNFGFLPLLSPTFWLALVQDYYLRFAPNWPTRITLGLHYNAQPDVLLAVSSFFSYLKLNQNFKIKKYLSLIPVALILISIILYRFILHPPFGLAYNAQFYKHTSDFKFLDKMVALIPKSASVMAPNNIVPRFAHQKAWILRNTYSDYLPDYIIYDGRLGQNPNDNWGVSKLDVLLADLKKDTSYKEFYHQGDQYIFKRVVNSTHH